MLSDNQFVREQAAVLRFALESVPDVDTRMFLNVEGSSCLEWIGENAYAMIDASSIDCIECMMLPDTTGDGEPVGAFIDSAREIPAEFFSFLEAEFSLDFTSPT